MVLIIYRFVSVLVWFLIMADAFASDDINKIIFTGFIGTWVLMFINLPTDKEREK